MIIGGYIFDGPYSIDTNFNEVAGVYVIFTLSNSWLDVGETDKLKSRVANHERKPCWKNHAGGNQIKLAFLHEKNQNRRLEIESALRSSLNPPCGDK